MYELKNYIKETGNYHFKIILGSSRTRVVGISGGSFVVSVTADNTSSGASELLSFIGKSLKIYGSSLDLVSGRGTKYLTVYISKR